MDGAEGVGDVDVGQTGQLFGKLGVVLGLALIEAGVLEQHDLAGLQGGGLGLDVGVHHVDVAGQSHRLAQQFAQALGHGLHAEGLQGLLPLLLGEGGGILALLGLLLDPLLEVRLGLAQVGAGDDGRAVVQQVLDGGQGGPDALVVSDGAAAVLGLGHVEVAPQEDFLAADVDVLDCLLVVIHSESSFRRFDVIGAGSNKF